MGRDLALRAALLGVAAAVLLVVHAVDGKVVTGEHETGNAAFASNAGLCAVRVFALHATVAQALKISGALSADPRAERVAFVSKARALQRMKQQYPGLIKQGFQNPFPDSWVVTPTHDDEADALGMSLRRRSLPGVSNVTWNTADPGCGA